MNVRMKIAAGSLLLLSISIMAQNAEPPYLRVRDVPHGAVQTREYTSKSLGTARKVIIYTPPGYEKSSLRYPVLYLLHGAGSTETSWTERGRAQVILDNL